MAATSADEQIFFHYDNEALQKEEDDLKDAILFYYPQSTDDNEQCALCGQLMGIVNLMKSQLGAPPVKFTLTHNKFAVKFLDKYILVLGGPRDCPDSILQEQLETLYSVFTFYQGSIHSVLQRCNYEKGRFLESLQDIWNSYVPFVRRYDHTLSACYNSVPYVPIPKGDTGHVMLEAAQLVQYCQRHYPVVAGCVVYKQSVLFTQLPVEITFRLLLIGPQHNQTLCVTCPVGYEPPSGVRLYKVFFHQDEFNQLFPNLQKYSHKPHNSNPATTQNIEKQKTKPETSHKKKRTKRSPRKRSNVVVLKENSDHNVNFRIGTQSSSSEYSESVENSSKIGGFSSGSQEKTAEIFPAKETLVSSRCSTSDSSIIKEIDTLENEEPLPYRHNAQTHNETPSLRDKNDCTTDYVDDSVIQNAVDLLTDECFEENTPLKSRTSKGLSGVCIQSLMKNVMLKAAVGKTVVNEQHRRFSRSLSDNTEVTPLSPTKTGRQNRKSLSTSEAVETRDSISVKDENAKNSSIKRSNSVEFSGMTPENAPDILSNSFPLHLNKTGGSLDGLLKATNSKTKFDAKFNQPDSMANCDTGITAELNENEGTQLNSQVNSEEACDQNNDMPPMDSLQEANIPMLSMPEMLKLDLGVHDSDDNLSVSSFKIDFKSKKSSHDGEHSNDTSSYHTPDISDDSDTNDNETLENQTESMTLQKNSDILDDQNSPKSMRISKMDSAQGSNPVDEINSTTRTCDHSDVGLADYTIVNSDNTVCDVTDENDENSTSKCGKTANDENIAATEPGKQEMSLYVQTNQDLQVMFLLHPGSNLDQKLCHRMWSDVLTIFASLGVELKELDHAQKQSPEHLKYKYLQFNESSRTLDGHVSVSNRSLVPVASDENQFCDSAVQLHADFMDQPSLSDVILRNHNSVIYGRKMASQETYFRRMLPIKVSSAPSEKDTSLLIEKRAREKLQQDKDIVII